VTQHHNQEGLNRQQHHRENLKSHTVELLLYNTFLMLFVSVH